MTEEQRAEIDGRFVAINELVSAICIDLEQMGRGPFIERAQENLKKLEVKNAATSQQMAYAQRVVALAQDALRLLGAHIEEQKASSRQRS